MWRLSYEVNIEKKIFRHSEEQFVLQFVLLSLQTDFDIRETFFYPTYVLYVTKNPLRSDLKS